MRDEQTNERRTLKIELLSQWKLEAESRNKEYKQRRANVKLQTFPDKGVQSVVELPRQCNNNWAEIQSVMDTFAHHFVLPFPKLVSLVILNITTMF